MSLAVLAVAAPAAADPGSTSRLGWVTNGEVRAAVQVGNTLYIGGSFTRVAPRTGVLGSLFGISAITGDLTSGPPLVDGTVNAVEPDGAGGYYIGGSFTTIGGVPRNRLAHLLSSGTVDPAFVPVVDAGVISSIRRGTTSLFVGGSLLQVNGGAQASLVALDPTTGASVPAWPLFTTAVRALLVHDSTVIAVFDGESSDAVSAVHQVTGATVWSTAGTLINAAVVAGTRLILGGRFNDPIEVLGVVSLDVATGARDLTWEPDKTFVPGPTFPIPSPVRALAVSGDTLYVGGSFTTFGGQGRPHAAAVTISTGTLADWAPIVDGDVVSLAVSPSGTVFMGGSFAHVNGQVRGDFAEVDAGGTLTEWVTNASWNGGRSLILNGDTLIVGTHHGVSGGGVHMNLAAFDLSTDTLLPWAPIMTNAVWRLAAIGDRLFVGAKQLVPVGLQLVDVISSVHAVSGATLPFALPPGGPAPRFDSGFVLLGAVGSHVYVRTGAVSSFGVQRYDAITGTADPSWFVGATNATHMTVSDDALYFADGLRIWVADRATGASSQWNVAVAPTAAIDGLAIDGRTLYAKMSNGSLAAFDRVSRLPVVGMPATAPPLQLLGNTVRAIAVADGQIVLAGSAVVASSPDGQAPMWNPALALASQFTVPTAGALLVTPTDVIVVGYEAETPVPVYGIGVFSRTPSVAPTSLRATTADNLVTLTWTAPSTPPTSYLLDVGAVSGSAAVTLPTGSPATSVTGVAGDATYYIRVRAAGAPAGPANAPSNEIALIVGCSAPPSAPPLSLFAQVVGANVTITWTPPPFTSASRYVLEAGSSAGASNLGRFTLPASQTTIGAPVPNGTYFIRIRSENDCGESATSTEIFFTVGGSTAIPPPPTGFSAANNIGGATVSATWNASPGALGYLLEVGSATGLSDLATVPLSTNTFAFTGSVPSGVYYLRVRAGNGAGLSAPSSEVVLRVSAP